MSKYFTRTFRVRWSEINALGQVGLAAFLQYVVETAWDWGAVNGLSAEESKALGLVWVIRETQINFYKPLFPNETFDFTIWLLKWRRVRGTRAFEIRLKDGGDVVARGTQQIVALNSQTLRPIEPQNNIMGNFRMENPRVIEHRRFPKFDTRPETAHGIQRVVEWRDLDRLEHVNNATYAAFSENAVIHALAAVGWPPSCFKNQDLAIQNRSVHIQYQSPALWGERLDVTAYIVELKPAGSTWHVAIERASDGEPIIRCVLKWSLVDRISGAEQILPGRLYDALKKTVGIVDENEVANHSKNKAGSVGR